jgi:hypothetical protein
MRSRVNIPLSVLMLLIVLAFSVGMWATTIAALGRGCFQ